MRAIAILAALAVLVAVMAAAAILLAGGDDPGLARLTPGAPASDAA